MIIRRIRAFAARSLSDRRLLLHAFALHTAIAVSCRLIRFGPLVRLLARIYPAREGCIALDTTAESRVVWAVATTSSGPIAGTCLTTALTTQCLLRRMGGDADLRFGVRAGSALSAHAWLESAGRVVVGHSAGAEYLPLD
jgi:hypothetical protein